MTVTDEIYAESYRNGFAGGYREGLRHANGRIASNAVKMGFSLEKICQIIELSKEKFSNPQKKLQ